MQAVKIDPLRLTVDATPSELARYLDVLLAAVPIKLWQRRTAQLIEKGREAGDSSLLVGDYEPEFAMTDLFTYRAEHGQLPPLPRSSSEHAILAFAVTFSQIYAHLSKGGKNRLANSVRGALKGKAALGPLAFELTTAMHLARRGFAIEFHDLELGGFDFVATKEGREVEIECKSFGRDIGRKIHGLDLVTLARTLKDVLAQALTSHPNTHIAITIPARLDSKKTTQDTIKECAKAALGSDSREAASEACTVEIRQLDPRNPAIAAMIRTRDVSVRAAAVDALGIDEPNVIFHVRLGIAIVVLSVKSARLDTVLTSMRDRLKDEVAHQLSGNRPTVLCVELTDITGGQLAELAQAERGGLNALLGRLFIDRQQLDAIVVISGEHLPVPDAGSQSAEYENVSYVCRRTSIDEATDRLISEMFG